MEFKQNLSGFYGVLKGRPIDRRLGTLKSHHYHIHVIDDKTHYRVAVNIESSAISEHSILEYYVNANFHHPLTHQLEKLEPGFTVVPKRPGGLALDYIRSNLFYPQDMRPLPPVRPGPDNDLNELLDTYVQRAINDQHSYICAFGDRWGPETDREDPYFGFFPGNGIHDIHMKQGNIHEFAHSDGTWQDGALFLYLPSEHRWIAIFLKFQSQTLHTDDHNGHRIETPATPRAIHAVNPAPHRPDFIVRIVSAVVHPAGHSHQQSVVLLNTTPDPINLAGWALVDDRQHKQVLAHHLIEPGTSLSIPIDPDKVHLSAEGGIITLLNAHGLKVHGVAYTRQQTRPAGWTITF